MAGGQKLAEEKGERRLGRRRGEAVEMQKALKPRLKTCGCFPWGVRSP